MKIPKDESELVNRRTDNTTAKGKRTNKDKQHITHNHNIVPVFMQHTLYLLQCNIHYIYYPFNIQLQLGIDVELSCS